MRRSPIAPALAAALLAELALCAPAGASIRNVTFRNGTEQCRLVGVTQSRQRPVDLVPGRSTLFRDVGGTQAQLTTQNGGKRTRDGGCYSSGKGGSVRATVRDDDAAPHDYEATVRGSGASVSIEVRKR